MIILSPFVLLISHRVLACFFIFFLFMLLIFTELYAEELRSGIYPIFPSHSLLVLPCGSWGSACFLL